MQQEIHEHKQIMTMKMRMIYGGLGGFLVFLVQFGLVDIQQLILSTDLFYFLGMAIRLLLAVFLGSVWVVVQRAESEQPMVHMQLGMVPVALIILMIGSIETPDNSVRTLALQNGVIQSNFVSNDHRFGKDFQIQIADRGDRAKLLESKTKESIVRGLTGRTTGGFRFGGSFVWVFISALLLTILSGFASVVLGMRAGPTPPPEISRLVERFSGTWTLGFGAVIGLIGGQQF